MKLCLIFQDYRSEEKLIQLKVCHMAQEGKAILSVVAPSSRSVFAVGGELV